MKITKIWTVNSAGMRDGRDIEDMLPNVYAFLTLERAFAHFHELCEEENLTEFDERGKIAWSEDGERIAEIELHECGNEGELK